VLSTLADALQKEEQEGPTTNSKVLAEEYGHVLLHLSAIFDPDAFLLLLPANGRMTFFLPFIEATFMRYAAIALRPQQSANSERYVADQRGEASLTHE